MSYKIPVACCIVYDFVKHKVLIARHKKGYSFLGGKIEFNETHLEACKRELEEECGLICNTNEIKFVGITNNPKNLCLFLLITKYTGVLDNREPHKMDDLRWVHLHELRNFNLSEGMKVFINSSAYMVLLELIKTADY